MSRSPVRFLVGVGLMAAVGCGNNNPVTTPTTPTPTTLTETFSGTIGVNGAATHSFVVQTSGSVTAGLASLTPSSDVTLGLGLGTWNGAICQVVLANDKAQQGSVILGTASSLGNLCVRIYDTGGLVEPVSYEIQVVHP